jgi:hypothetical protein
MSLRNFPALTPGHLEAHRGKPTKSCRSQTPCSPSPKTIFAKESSRPGRTSDGRLGMLDHARTNVLLRSNPECV